jgi:hypothetical protein
LITQPHVVESRVIFNVKILSTKNCTDVHNLANQFQREADSPSAGRKVLSSGELEILLSFLKYIVHRSCSEPLVSSRYHHAQIMRYLFLLSYQPLLLGLKTGLTFKFPIRLFCIFLISTSSITSPSHLTLLDFIAIILIE